MTTIPDIKTAIYRYLNLSSEITKDRFTDKFQEPLEAGNRDSLVHTSWISDILHWRDSIMKGQRFSSIIFSNINELESIERKLGSVKKLPLIMRYYIADCLLNIYSSTPRFYRDLRDLRRKVRNKTTMKSIVYLNNDPYLITKSFTDVYGNNHVYVRQYAGGFFQGLSNTISKVGNSIHNAGKSAVKGTPGFFKKATNTLIGKKRAQTIIDNVKNSKGTLGKTDAVIGGTVKGTLGAAKRVATAGAIAGAGALAIGGVAAYGTGKLAVGAAKKVGSAAGSATRATVNAVKSVIPPKPEPVGNAAQANPAAQPQAVIHHHHYGS